MEKTILVVHGPNLHLLGRRQPRIYGKEDLKSINKKLAAEAKKNKLKITVFQSNIEGEIVEKITKTKYDLLIINPAAYTHTSIAIRDAISALDKPAIEVHISNIYKRESFRKKSLISDIVTGTIGGFGTNSYFLAMKAAAPLLKK